ncbi:unnamed protein product [Sphagnum balticum]
MVATIGSTIDFNLASHMCIIHIGPKANLTPESRCVKDGVWLNGPVPKPRFKLTPRPHISPSQSHHISLISVPSRARPFFPCAALLWLQFCGIGSSFLRSFLSASVLRKGGEGSHAFAWLFLLGYLFV